MASSSGAAALVPAARPLKTLTIQVPGYIVNEILEPGDQLKVKTGSWGEAAADIFFLFQAQHPEETSVIEGPTLGRCHGTTTYIPQRPGHETEGNLNVYYHLRCGRATSSYSPRVCPNSLLQLGVEWFELRAFKAGGRLDAATVKFTLCGIGTCDHDPSMRAAQRSSTARSRFREDALQAGPFFAYSTRQDTHLNLRGSCCLYDKTVYQCPESTPEEAPIQLK